MSLVELERELAFAEQMKVLHGTWQNASAEYRRALRARRPSTGSSRARKRGPGAGGAEPEPVLALPPPELDRLAQVLSTAIAGVADGRHGLYLALSGALLARGVDAKVLPALVARIAKDARDAKVRARVSDAVSTARARERGAPVTGFLTLRANWPQVAAALDTQLPMAPSAALHSVTRALSAQGPKPALPLAAAAPLLRAMLVRALGSDNTLTAMQLPPGVGKTRETLDAALPLDRRIAFVHPTNAVAREQYRLACRRDANAVQRRFGVLSVLAPDGSPVCKKADIARALQKGGMPVPQRLCIRCPERDGCTARHGREGPASARMAILNHAMIDAALDHAGTGGAIVIDELPPAVVHTDITVQDIDAALGCLRSGAYSWVLSSPAMPMLELLRVAAGLSDHGETLVDSLARAAASLTEPRPLTNQLIVAAAAFVRAPDETAIDLDLDQFDLPTPVPGPELTGSLHAHAIEMFGAALRQWPHHSVPPASRRMSRLLVNGLASAAEVARASRVLAVLGRLVNQARTVKPAPTATWEVSDDVAILAVTEPNEGLQRCLQYGGPVLILDATPDILALQSLSARHVDVQALDVLDGSPVSRRILATFRGAKRYLAPGAQMDWAAFAPLLCEALVVSGASAGGNILLMTHKPCADALRSGLTSGIPHPGLHAMLQVRSANACMAISHFGNVRGRNDFEGLSWGDLDVVITLGDPWPDMRLLKRENMMLGLTLEQGEERGVSLAAAELAQAHGRLRAPRQTKPTCAVHVGAVAPMGWSLANTTMHQLQDGRPKQPSAMEIADFCACITRAGGNRALARVMGCSDSTIRRYFGGRPIPAEFADELRRLYGRAASPSFGSEYAGAVANDIRTS